MKWIGQYIYDQISRFRNDVYLEDISSGTIASGGNLGLDSNNKIVKAAEVGSAVDLTSEVTGTLPVGNGGTGVTSITALKNALDDETWTFANNITGTLATAAQTNITSLGTLTSLNVDDVTLNNKTIQIQGDTDDRFSIETGAAGATTLTTDDNAGSNGHFEIEADGEITLDANGSINLEAFDNKAVYIHADNNSTIDALNIDCNELTTGSAVKIDVDDALTASATKSLMHIDYDKSGNTASAQSSLVTGLEISMDDAATGNAADSVTLLQGIKVTCDAANNTGAANQNGVQVILTDGDTGASSIGYISQVEDGGIDFIARSSADIGDYFSISTGTKGATTLTTVDNAGTDADLDFAIDGTFSVASTGIDIATNGTITNAVWQGTAIATSYLKHKTCFELTGYSVADGTNYFYSNIMSGNKAPFLHDVNIGSDGLTADNPAAFLRANGTVMTYAGTLKIWKGWAASNGTPTVDVGIFKYTPTANDATSVSLVLVKNTQFTGAGNDNLKTFSETSFSVAVAAGDILITGIKGSTSDKTAYFVSTVEIEWS